MTDLLQRQNSTKESEGFNVQSFNYGESDTVAHVIAHRSIVAGADTSYVYENNNLYSGGNSNGSVRTSVWSNCCSTYNYIWNQRNGSNRNTGQNNRVVCLKDLINSQNNKSRTPAVVDVRGSETLQDWICNAERIPPDRVLISKLFVLMLFYFVIKHKQ